MFTENTTLCGGSSTNRISSKKGRYTVRRSQPVCGFDLSIGDIAGTQLIALTRSERKERAKHHERDDLTVFMRRSLRSDLRRARVEQAEILPRAAEKIFRKPANQ